MAVAIARPKLEGNIAVGDDRQIGFAEFGDPQGRAIFWLHGTPGARRQIPMEANPLEVIDSPDLPPLWQVFGGHRRPDGHWGLPELAVEVASPDAALHIGPQFVMLETAAIDAAAAFAGTDVQGISAHVMFLARSKTGPFRIQTEPMAGADDTTAVRVLMRDEGNGDRLTTAGSYQFRSV
jgi:hypothetical protein